MNVELLSCTPDALNLLLRTKNTRLAFNSDPREWSDEDKASHLEYMLGTIKSSWEFVDYTFRISGVTRAFTHQLVRTRTGSYAQESQRTVDVRDHNVVRPDYNKIDDPAEAEECYKLWEAGTTHAMACYGLMIEHGMPVQDARGILPTNVTTSIIAKFDLRTLHETAKVRLCTRTQGEYQTVFRAMRERVLEVHPWAEPFIQVHCVATGTCAFPRYGKTDCKFYDPRMDNDALKLELKERFWAEQGIHAANPIANKGMAS